MRISTKGRYGLRAIIDIAAHSDKGQIPIKEVSKRQGISDNYLEQIIFPLKKAGIVQSVRGSQGGYFLARPAKEITAGEVLRVLEGDLAPVECLANGTDVHCNRAKNCPTLSLWIRLKDAINEVVDSVSIQDLVDESREQIEVDFGNFI